MAAPHLKTGKFLLLSLQKEEKQKYRKKNPVRLVTKHNCAGFLLCRLRYPAMKNGLLSKMPHSESQSHNFPFCNVVQLQWEKPFQIPHKLGIQDKTWENGVFKALLIPHSSPILNFPLPKVPELDVTKSSSEIPKSQKLQETIRKQENKLYTINLYLCQEMETSLENPFSAIKKFGARRPSSPPPPLYLEQRMHQEYVFEFSC